MVQQPTERRQQTAERLEVLPHLGHADVLEHADRRDDVEPFARQVAVVLHPDLHPVANPGLVNPAARQVGLLAAQGDPHHARIEPGGGVDGHGSPAATDIEQPGPSLFVQAELAADQLVLGLLRGLKAHRFFDEAGARVRHRRPQDESVEVVAHVVVVADRRRVPGRGVSSPGRLGLFGRVRQRAADGAQLAGRVECGGQGGQRGHGDPRPSWTG